MCEGKRGLSAWHVIDNDVEFVAIAPAAAVSCYLDLWPVPLSLFVSSQTARRKSPSRL